MIFKAQIFLRLGYLEIAYDLFSKIQMVIMNSKSGSVNELDEVPHLPFSEGVDYLECALGVLSIEIETSRNYQSIEKSLLKCEEIVKSMFSNKDCELLRKVKILRLNLARDLIDFGARNKIADELGLIYQSYDHYRLVRCEDFMLFVKERVQYLMDDCKHDIALFRVQNILSILDPVKGSYWFRIYKVLEAECLTHMRRGARAYDILQEVLHESVLVQDPAKLRDYRLFVDVHFALGSLG